MRSPGGEDQSHPRGAEAGHRVGSKDFRKPGVDVNETMIELMGGGGPSPGDCPQGRREDGEEKEPVTVNYVVCLLLVRQQRTFCFSFTHK